MLATRIRVWFGIFIVVVGVATAAVVFRPRAIQTTTDTEDIRIVFAHAKFGKRTRDRPVHVAINVQTAGRHPENANVYSENHWREDAISVQVTVKRGMTIEVFVTQQMGEEGKEMSCWFTNPQRPTATRVGYKTTTPLTPLRVECMHRPS